MAKKTELSIKNQILEIVGDIDLHAQKLDDLSKAADLLGLAHLGGELRHISVCIKSDAHEATEIIDKITVIGVN